ncbi:hypothetical protein NDR87_29980 [Nocardia sp. CDC159]|uniref:Uncharacterized protein n=1 Tax=Nocardia pulmonis TaxID=2951408 RepID=A0A9X2EC38_9NOCA|nr:MULTISPECIES: hypothetical protein [Nocardia]MCM6777590.1 hypothetical protein [Nocardia pulmonis]MCM6790606.1 hypothetical protein [Nocardia sp. CDC159]
MDIKTDYPYYMVLGDDPGRGVTFEAYSNWDWVLFANEAGTPSEPTGTPVRFTRVDRGYYLIHSTGCNWADYQTWRADSGFARPGICLVPDNLDNPKTRERPTVWHVDWWFGDTFRLQADYGGREHQVTWSTSGKRWLAHANRDSDLQSDVPGISGTYAWASFKLLEA